MRLFPQTSTARGPLLPVLLTLAALTATLLPLAALAPQPAPAAAAEPRRSGCVEASGPFHVGTTTVTVRSRGRDLPATVAYPATSDGVGATPVCRVSPLVLAGHGSGGDGASAAALHGYLVEAGYVVAAPTFPGGFDIAGYAKDVRRTLTTVRAVSDRSGGLLSGRVRQGGPVGYIGTSMGAIVGLALVDSEQRDGRIRAVVAKAGTSFDPTFRPVGGPPLLMLNGDADTVIPYAGARETYQQARRTKGLITLSGVGHDLDTGGDPVLRTTSTAFLDRFLRSRDHALGRLQRIVSDSEVASLRKRW
ncbi:alpha/beta hydrolase family protein [Nocardioides sp. Leaf374]|uniref:alpha/beta hydrolase family protein n=1 Tax=Nocardioides sp. Leaf374 TaxID=2876560 RepID=UPI001E4454A7|nr:alpha/beta hydrolase [Nocardioides sp. Leaf374]